MSKDVPFLIVKSARPLPDPCPPGYKPMTPPGFKLERHRTRAGAERALAILNAHEAANGRGDGYWEITEEQWTWVPTHAGSGHWEQTA